MSTTSKSLGVKLPQFWTWALSTMDRLRKTIGVGGLLVSAVAVYWLEPMKWVELYLSGQLNEYMASKNSERMVVLLLQAGVCLLLAIITPHATIPQKLRGHANTAMIKQACKVIRKYLMGLFLLWTLYYLTSAIGLFSELSFSRMGQAENVAYMKRVMAPILISLSAATSAVLVLLYIEMARLTIRTNDKDESDRMEDRQDRSSTFKFFSVTLFALIIAITWIGFAVGKSDLVRFTDVLVALASAVGLCLVVGRFGHEYFDPGGVVISLLYFYAVIQILAIGFGDQPVVHAFVTTIALPLKILFWLVCVWAFTTGVLAEYVDVVRELILRVDREREGNV